MTRVVLTRSMVPGDIQYIKDGLDKKVKDQYEFVAPTEYTEESISNLVVNADILLGPYVTKRILANAKQLKFIQVPWTGMDTFDFSAVQGVSVPVCNTHSNADSVAELGVTMVLDLLKKVSYHDRKMRVGNWNRDQKPLDLKAKMLSKQTVCILGFGNIGSRIGGIIAAFGAKIIAVHDRAKANDVLSEVYATTQIFEALSKADVVICTLPLTEATKGLINDEMLSKTKNGALFVNMSRAAIVDEDAAWNALNDGRLSGFASDVWWNVPKRGETESYPSAKHEFWKLDNVIISPHRAGFVESCLPHLDGAIENIIAFIKGEPLQCVVDTTKGY